MSQTSDIRPNIFSDMRLTALFCLTTIVAAETDPRMWLFKTRALNQRQQRNYGAYGAGHTHNDPTYYKRADGSHPFNMDQYML